MTHVVKVVNIANIRLDAVRTAEARAQTFNGKPPPILFVRTEEELETDEIIVSASGHLLYFGVVIDENVAATALAGATPGRFIQRVDLSAYDAFVAREKRKAELKKQLDAELEQVSEIDKYSLLARINPDAKKKVNELADLLGVKLPSD